MKKVKDTLEIKVGDTIYILGFQGVFHPHKVIEILSDNVKIKHKFYDPIVVPTNQLFIKE